MQTKGRDEIDVESTFDKLSRSKLSLTKITNEGLDVDYGILMSNSVADEVFRQLQDKVEYYEGDLNKVRVFGKWHQIPRQQVAYGDENLKYSFSGTTVQAKPWIPVLLQIKNLLEKVTGYSYNFVLVNRYSNGNDHIGEHRDAEPEIDKNTPIASISLGQERQFVLKHGDTRKKGALKRNIAPVKINLEHGSVLLMNPPTNQIWYHSLPARKSARNVRINF